MIRTEVKRTPDFQRAQCRGQTRLFEDRFRNEPTDARAARHTAAKALCHQCPCLEACDTLRRKQRFPTGVWAGRTYKDRH